VFFHAQFELKPERAREPALIAIEVDLSFNELMTQIALPYIRDEHFFCGGVRLQASKVKQFTFTETEQSSDDLLPLLRARAVRNGVFVAALDKSSVVWEGKDITRYVLKDAKDLAAREITTNLERLHSSMTLGDVKARTAAKDAIDSANKMKEDGIALQGALADAEQRSKMSKVFIMSAGAKIGHRAPLERRFAAE
jgi:hypothetical protein